MLTAIDVRNLHDKAFVHGQSVRERGADDLLFYWITQWDDSNLGGSSLQYRGQFDMLRKAGRQIMTNIKSNPTQVDFEPVDGTDDNGGDIIDGMYRSDMRNNTALEAKETATTETIVCGYGAWELITEYKTTRAGDNKQVIKRYPINEANNNVFWDPNAKLADKSDADFVSCLIPYSTDGYKSLLEEYGEDSDGLDVPSSFAFPEHSYVFPWIEDSAIFYVTRFFHRKKIKVTMLTFVDMLGSEKQINKMDLSDQEEALFEDGFELESEIQKEIYEVTLYLVGGGDEIIHSQVVPGGHIPVVPMYGERAFVEGVEYYEGITRLAKDPQRLRNFQLSYLADIVAKSPRQKPIFYPEQIQGFEDMYQESGPDNDYPYLLQNMLDASGNPLPIGSQGVLPEQPMPQALVASIQASREAINDVASADLPQDIGDTNLSGKALNALQKRFDMQSFTYQHNLKSALRREGEIYASMAAVVYDEEQEVSLTKLDGTRATEMINQESINADTLELEVLNDVTKYIFDVYADIGPSFQSQKEESRTELKEMIATMPPDDPMRQIMLLEYWTLQDGKTFEDMRNYARKQLILQGIKEPDTDEEKQMLEEANQAQENQDDPNMLIAQAEMVKGQAEQLNAQNKQQEIQMDGQLKMQDFELRRMETELDTQKFLKGQDDKLNVAAATIDQNQQKIDNADKKAMGELAIKLSELESKLNENLNGDIAENMLVFDSNIGDFVAHS